ncbi:MAG: hypothetical protein ACQEQL_02670 [Pseudomonadota bacterium]
MPTEKTLKSLTADFLKSAYYSAQDPKRETDQRLAAVRQFKENWRLYTQDHQVSAQESLREIGITDSPLTVLSNMRAVLLSDLKQEFKTLSRDQSSRLTQRADQAFELMRKVENMKKNFLKDWDFAYPKDQADSLKQKFHYKALSMDAFGDLNKLPQLVYDLNLKAARSLYQEMIDNSKIDVQNANHDIFKYMVQAGFDDASTKSLNNGKYELDVEVYIRALDPKLGWFDFCDKLSDLAIKRGQMDTPTTYFGPLPKDMDDSGVGNTISPSKNMRRYTAAHV